MDVDAKTGPDQITAPLVVQSRTFGAIAVIERDCPLCGHGNAGEPERAESFDVWTVRRCAKCGFVYTDKAFYGEHPPADVRLSQSRLSKLTRFRMHLLPRKQWDVLVEVWAQPGAVMDLGCRDAAWAEDLSPAFVPYGIEPDPHLAEAAAQRLIERGGACINGPIVGGLSMLEDGFFSTVLLRSRLQREVDPLGVLRETHRVLRPGGVVLVKVPNFGSLNRMVMGAKWCGLRYPGHINHFTENTLSKMGEKAGFNVHHGLTFTLPTSDTMYAAFKKAGGRSRRYSACRGG